MYAQNRFVEFGKLLTSQFAHKSAKCAQDAHIIWANSARKLRQTVVTAQAGTENFQCLPTICARDKQQRRR